MTVVRTNAFGQRLMPDRTEGEAEAQEARREDHCVHPERQWCDCDWCRLNGHWQVQS